MALPCERVYPSHFLIFLCIDVFMGFYNYFITKYANNKIIIVVFTKKDYLPSALRSREKRV